MTTFTDYNTLAPTFHGPRLLVEVFQFQMHVENSEYFGELKEPVLTCTFHVAFRNLTFSGRMAISQIVHRWAYLLHTE